MATMKGDVGGGKSVAAKVPRNQHRPRAQVPAGLRPGCQRELGCVFIASVGFGRSKSRRCPDLRQRRRSHRCLARTMPTGEHASGGQKLTPSAMLRLMPPSVGVPWEEDRARQDRARRAFRHRPTRWRIRRASSPERVWQELEHRLMDIQERRIAEMDAPRHRDDDAVAQRAGGAGHSRSRSAPTRSRAGPTTILAEQVRKRPDRFQGLAALPMQDPDGATRELERCVQGARLPRRAGQRLLAGRRRRDDGRYYDLPQYRPFWAAWRNARRAVLSASAQSAAARRADLRRPSLAARPDLGLRRRRPRCMRCA